MFDFLTNNNMGFDKFAIFVNDYKTEINKIESNYAQLKKMTIYYPFDSEGNLHKFADPQNIRYYVDSTAYISNTILVETLIKYLKSKENEIDSFVNFPKTLSSMKNNKNTHLELLSLMRKKMNSVLYLSEYLTWFSELLTDVPS